MPRSAATLTTSRLVEVPIVVLMPPTSVANPIGISTLDAGVLVRSDTLIRIGSSSTTIGTLLTNALSTPPITSVNSREIDGAAVHARASSLPTGSSAPVRTSP